MKEIIILSTLFFSSLAHSTFLEGRYIEQDEKCSILINEKQLSGKKKLSVQCELFLVNQYKYRYQLDTKKCPYKVKKIKIIPPGVDAKVFQKIGMFKDCAKE